MRNLLLFLQRYTHILLFIVLEIVSLSLLFNYGKMQRSVFFSTTNSFIATIDRLSYDVTSFMSLRDVNKRLERENTKLKLQNEALKASIADSLQTLSPTAMRVYESLVSFPQIEAKVTSNEQRADRLNHLVINKGSDDGVKSGMGVIGGGGVIGIVAEAGANYSLVIPVTNKRSAISCRIRGTNWFGYLVWEGGSKLIAYMDEVPRYAEAKRGMAIETSGYSDIFPPGIFVGNILSAENAPDGQSLRLTIHLGTDFSNLRNVSVVKNTFRSQIDTLRNHAAFNEGLLDK